MITRNFPVLIVPLASSQVLGILVGTQQKTIASTKEEVLLKISKELNKTYRKSGKYPNAYFKQVKLKSITIKLHPSYVVNRSLSPLSNELAVPVWAVYGKVNDNFQECLLPFLDASFRYRSLKHLNALISHYGSHYLNAMEPREVFQMIMMPTPDLSVVQLKVNENRKSNFGQSYLHTKNHPLLTKVATQYPGLKKRAKSVVPDIAWNRAQIIDRLLHAIIVSKSSILIVGESGVGKSTVLRATMRKIVADSKKQGLGFTFWNLLPDSLWFSGKYLGDWQENSLQLIEELSSSNGILWVENIIELLTLGGEDVSDSIAASFLPALKNQSLQIIGEIAPKGLTFLRKNFPNFAQLFRIVPLDEMDNLTLHDLFNKYIAYIDQNHKIRIEQSATQTAFRLLEKYYPYEAFPGKMITFLGDCVNIVKNSDQIIVDKELVYRRFSEKSGLQSIFIRDEIKLNTSDLKCYFEDKIIGQPAAVEKCISLVKIFKTGLNNPSKPIHVMLFAGPTGVGKSEMTKVLARYFFGGGKGNIPLIQFDMSEFQYPEQIFRLIGSEKEPGKLVKKIKEMPFAVILFDEIEKASPAIYNALLTIFDEGQMMDARGNIVNFKNTIIIMTSNIGVQTQASPSYLPNANTQQQYSSAIHRFFSPEFINRMDDVIIFNKLAKSDLRKIAIIELEKLNKREGLIAQKLTIKTDPILVNKMVEIGYDAELGARPIKRAIGQQVVVPLSKWILQHKEITDAILHLSLEKNSLIINPVPR